MARIRGDRGDNVLIGTAARDRIDGVAGDDSLYGGSGRDELDGGKGDDALYGGSGKDELNGGKGDDALYGGSGKDELDGGGDDDALYGGSGKDELDGGKGDDALYGGSGKDELDGGKGDDALYGGSGKDELDGGKGDDALYGGGGKDELDGGGGDDALHGGSGKDELDGGDGDDLVDGGAGSDHVDGGRGDDIGVHNLAENAGSSDFYDGGKGSDTLRLNLTQSQANSAEIQADIQAFERFLAENSNPNRDDGPVFQFSAFNLKAQDWESLEVIVDRGAPTLSIGDAEVTEGGILSFDVTLDVADPAKQTTASYTIMFAVPPGNGNADGDDLAPATLLTGQVTIPAGDTSATIEVGAFDDLLIEGTETFRVTLSDLSANVQPGDLEATGTILDDEPEKATVSIADAEVIEGGALSFTVSADVADQNALISATYTISFATAPGNGNAEQADLTLATPLTGTVEIPAGATMATIEVRTFDDTLFEGDEIFTIALSDFSDNAMGGDVEATGTILDNDPPPLAPVIDLTSLTADQGFIIQGDAVYDGAGQAVSSAGDVNGDGFDDLIVGADGGDDGGAYAGEAYVVFGTAGGFGLDVAGRQVIDLTGLTAAEGFIIQGDAASDFAGHSVSSAGDVNGDGFDDLIVGAGGGDDGGNNAGEAYVVFGTGAGFGVDVAGRQVIDLTGLTAAQGFIIQGDTVYDNAGFSVSSAGDVNGDGFDDLIVGAALGDDGGDFAGEAYVVFGRGAQLRHRRRGGPPGDRPDRPHRGPGLHHPG